MKRKNVYYVTTPIYYVNGQPHVGAAFTTVACDVLARYHRLRGRKTWFVTGTDENATNVHEAAREARVAPPEFADSLAGEFRLAWDQLGIRPDVFIRTTEARHARAVQEFFHRLRDRDYVYLDDYEGWYSVRDETFYRDSEVKDGVAIETGRPVERVKEANYFFRLSAFGDRLLKHIEANPEFLQPDSRRNEVVSFIADGLRDMSVTRANRGWGIPVPGEPDKVIYVWFDALINYLTAIGWPDDPGWERYWPADLHVMGKEIFVRFHATLWPAMLMALDFRLPRAVYAHGWFTVQGAKGGKHSASLPHPTNLSRLIAERSGAPFAIAADAQRYLLCREMNSGQDTEFAVTNLLRRFNTDLANDLGNLLNRTLKMVSRYRGGIVPVATVDREITELAAQVRGEFERAMDAIRLNEALEAAWRLVARMNKFIDEQAPWDLDKAARRDDAGASEQLSAVLYACLEATRIVAVLVTPFMPVAAGRLRLQLGCTVDGPEPGWDDTAWGGLQPGVRMGEASPIFPRIQDLTVDEETLEELSHAPTSRHAKGDTETLSDPSVAPSGAAAQPREPEQQTLSFEDFMRVDLRVAEVLMAEPVPDTTKLLRLTVRVGESDTRTILAGIAEFYRPEELVGRKIVVVANLQPRKMRGIESQGMLLAADIGGRAVLVHPDSDVPAGSRVR